VYWGVGTLVKRYNMSDQRGPAAAGFGRALQQVRDHPHGHLHALLGPAHGYLMRLAPRCEPGLIRVPFDANARARLRLEPRAYTLPLFSSM